VLYSGSLMSVDMPFVIYGISPSHFEITPWLIVEPVLLIVWAQQFEQLPVPFFPCFKLIDVCFAFFNLKMEREMDRRCTGPSW